MSTTVSCPNCGGALAAGDQYCGRCGTSFAGAFAATILGGVSPWDEVAARLRDVTTGEFQILGELGRGGMAAVYLAHDIALNRKVAIKVMSPGIMMGPGMMERFRQEAVTVANLNHPNIVTIHAVRQAGGLYYFVMKLIPGASLERLIREIHALPIPVIQALVYQVGSALAYAHKKRVIHRDVKPSNVLLDDDGNAVVTDFGIAKVVESPSQTQTGTTVGTPAYMSPEQCWSKEVTAASDQYALGIVVYEMLTGRPPFSGPTLAILRAHTEDPPPPIWDLRSDCPPELGSAVHRMLEKDPARRWPTVMKAVDALGGRPTLEGDPVAEELVRLSRLGPDHPLSLLPTPHSPIPAQRASPPPAPSPSGSENLIQVRMRPGSGSTPPAVSVAPPSSSGPAGSDPAVAPVAGLPSLARIGRWAESLPRRWWVVPALMAALVLLWLVPRLGSGRREAIDQASVDTTTRQEPRVMPVARVELAGVPERVTVGDTFLLAVTARSAQGEALPGRDVVWSSSRREIAGVSPTGEVTALAAGRATITARVEAESALVVVPVGSARPVKAVVSPGTVRLKLRDSTQVRVRLLDEQGGVREGVAIWESLDEAVATVSSAGVIVARGIGSTRVLATADGIQGTGTVTVIPRESADERGTGGSSVLRMLVSPWANVTIDARARGQRVRGEDTLSAGVPHRLRFSRDGYITVDTTVTLRTGEQRLLRILMKRRAR